MSENKLFTKSQVDLFESISSRLHFFQEEFHILLKQKCLQHESSLIYFLDQNIDFILLEVKKSICRYFTDESKSKKDQEKEKIKLPKPKPITSKNKIGLPTGGKGSKKRTLIIKDQPATSVTATACVRSSNSAPVQASLNSSKTTPSSTSSYGTFRFRRGWPLAKDVSPLPLSYLEYRRKIDQTNNGGCEGSKEVLQSALDTENPAQISEDEISGDIDNETADDHEGSNVDQTNNEGCDGTKEVLQSALDTENPAQISEDDISGDIDNETADDHEGSNEIKVETLKTRPIYPAQCIKEKNEYVENQTTLRINLIELKKIGDENQIKKKVQISLKQDTHLNVCLICGTKIDHPYNAYLTNEKKKKKDKRDNAYNHVSSHLVYNMDTKNIFVDNGFLSKIKSEEELEQERKNRTLLLDIEDISEIESEEKVEKDGKNKNSFMPTEEKNIISLISLPDNSNLSTTNASNQKSEQCKTLEIKHINSKMIDEQPHLGKWFESASDVIKNYEFSQHFQEDNSVTVFGQKAQKAEIDRTFLEYILKAFNISCKHFTHTCYVCNIKVMNCDILGKHKKFKHTLRKFKYSSCRKLSIVEKTKKMFICHLCGKSFARERALNVHIKLHENKSLFRCDVCGMDLATDSSLIKHKKYVHSLDKFGKPLTSLGECICEFCGASFTVFTSYKCHLMNVHPNEKFEISCGRCKIVFPTVWEYKQHCSTHHRSKTKEELWHLCKICGRKFKNINGLKQHHIRAHIQSKTKEKMLTERRFQCFTCQRFFEKRISLRLHQSRVHMNIHKCNICDRTFTNKFALQLHQFKVHKVQMETKLQEGNQCKICEQFFASKLSLKLHRLRIHTNRTKNQEGYQCDVCGKTLKDRYQFKMHQALVHMILSENLNTCKCNVCGRICRDEYRFKLHQQVHKQAANSDGEIKLCNENKREFNCDNCKMVFQREHNFFKHRETCGVEFVNITKEKMPKKYSCDMCEKRFSTKYVFDNHYKTVHGGQALPRCKICNKTFALTSSLKAHMSLHTGEKPYKCNICGKAFRRPYGMQCHRRIHTGEKPYQCSICGRRFRQMGDRTVHERRHKDKASQAKDKHGAQ